MPGTVLDALTIIGYLILITALRSRHYYFPHFTDELTMVKTLAQSWAWDLNSGSLTSRPHPQLFLYAATYIITPCGELHAYREI